MMENWSTGKKTLENKSVVEKMQYNKICDRVFADMWAPAV